MGTSAWPSVVVLLRRMASSWPWLVLRTGQGSCQPHQGCICGLLYGALQGFPAGLVPGGGRGVPPTLGWAQRKWTAGVPLGLALDISSFYALT